MGRKLGGGAGRLGSIRGRGGQHLHGRVSLCGGGRLLVGGVEVRGAGAGRVLLVMGPQGILHPRVGIVDVLHRDVTIAIAELGVRRYGGAAEVLRL